VAYELLFKPYLLKNLELQKFKFAFINRNNIGMFKFAAMSKDLLAVCF
jgi:hypothetical protein